MNGAATFGDQSWRGKSGFLRCTILGAAAWGSHDQRNGNIRNRDRQRVADLLRADDAMAEQQTKPAARPRWLRADFGAGDSGGSGDGGGDGGGGGSD